jgi:hypothetical protein
MDLLLHLQWRGKASTNVGPEAANQEANIEVGSTNVETPFDEEPATEHATTS